MSAGYIESAPFYPIDPEQEKLEKEEKEKQSQDAQERVRQRTAHREVLSRLGFQLAGKCLGINVKDPSVPNSKPACGEFGCIYQSVDEKYAVKYTEPPDSADGATYAVFLSDVEREYEIGREMGSIGVGPPVVDGKNCPQQENGKPQFLIRSDWCEGFPMVSPTFGQLRFQQRIAAVVKLYEKIQKMHKAGVVHLDLHEGNVMLCGNIKSGGGIQAQDDHEVWIIDYGWARKWMPGDPVVDARFRLSAKTWEHRVMHSGNPSSDRILKDPQVADLVIVRRGLQKCKEEDGETFLKHVSASKILDAVDKRIRGEEKRARG